MSSAPFLNCTTILIEDDSVAENTEQFFVLLGSTDDAVEIGTDFATVTILDISSTHLVVATCMYFCEREASAIVINLLQMF